MFALGWAERGAVWQWWKRLWEWKEELLGKCKILLSDVTLQDQSSDRWLWKLDLVGGYSVRSVYQMLIIDDSHTLYATSNLIWHRHVPAKVSILAWRLLRNRLSTKDILVAHGILTREAHLCVTECGNIETTQYFFLSCTIIRYLWHLVCDWIGVSMADPYSIPGHFVQFTYLTGGLVAR